MSSILETEIDGLHNALTVHKRFVDTRINACETAIEKISNDVDQFALHLVQIASDFHQFQQAVLDKLK